MHLDKDETVAGTTRIGNRSNRNFCTAERLQCASYYRQETMFNFASCFASSIAGFVERMSGSVLGQFRPSQPDSFSQHSNGGVEKLHGDNGSINSAKNAGNAANAGKEVALEKNSDKSKANSLNKKYPIGHAISSAMHPMNNPMKNPMVNAMMNPLLAAASNPAMGGGPMRTLVPAAIDPFLGVPMAPLGPIPMAPLVPAPMPIMAPSWPISTDQSPLPYGSTLLFSPRFFSIAFISCTFKVRS